MVSFRVVFFCVMSFRFDLFRFDLFVSLIFTAAFVDGLDLTGLDGTQLRNYGASQREPAVAPVPFVPEERTVTQLVEMGFDREHVLMALRATETNRVEVAMEHILSHPPPTPGERVLFLVGAFYAFILLVRFGGAFRVWSFLCWP